jgi:hypothetical protein
MNRKDWLLYFNDFLRDHGIITESEHRRMATAIISGKI